ncbi:MAG: YcbK family protein [Elusimicrobia bacterium]|nr:YcbK family protein [Elusimicrobiota bacterium]
MFLLLAGLVVLQAATASAADLGLRLPACALFESWEGVAPQAGFDRAAALIAQALPAEADEAEGEEADDELEAGVQGDEAQAPVRLGDGRLALHSSYWKERVDVVYRKADGTYDPAGVDQIRRIFRCKLNGAEIDIPVGLIELLDAIQDHFKADAIELLSGYRSPERNAKMRKKSSGVAKNSMHIKGWAADIHVPGVALGKLRDFASSLKAGGVGYYPKSGFVHVDVGRVRYW